MDVSQILSIGKQHGRIDRQTDRQRYRQLQTAGILGPRDGLTRQTRKKIYQLAALNKL